MSYTCRNFSTCCSVHTVIALFNGIEYLNNIFKNKQLKAQEKEKLKEEEENKKLLDEYWSEGTNKKGEKKAKMEHDKQMEKMQKAKEKQELLQADEEMTSNVKVTAKKGKKSKTDDF